MVGAAIDGGENRTGPWQSFDETLPGLPSTVHETPSRVQVSVIPTQFDHSTGITSSCAASKT